MGKGEDTLQGGIRVTQMSDAATEIMLEENVELEKTNEIFRTALTSVLRVTERTHANAYAALSEIQLIVRRALR